MISIIISSANPKLLTQVSENIATTIGVPYELLGYDNSAGSEGICAIYNRGAREARYEVLCFMHEDVLMKTPDWGKALLNLMERNPAAGLIGVAGSSYKTMAPSSWWHINKSINCEHIHILQGQRGSSELVLQDIWPTEYVQAKVAAVDGVWMATKKDIALNFPFDEQLLKGFHGYDLDFSLSIGEKYDVLVTRDILLAHFSEGHYSKGWLADILSLHRKWMSRLPVNIARLDERTQYANEKRAFKHILQMMTANGYSRFQLLRELLYYFPLYRRFGYRLLFSLSIAALRLKKSLLIS